MNSTEFIHYWIRLVEDPSNDLRKGQLAFNYLTEIKPDLANEIRGTYADPFYDDEKIDFFVSFITDNW